MTRFAKALALLASAGIAAASVINPMRLQTMLREVVPEDAIGEFTSFFDPPPPAVCAETIAHTATASGDPPKIPHPAMTMDGGACQPLGGMPVYFQPQQAINSVNNNAPDGTDTSATVALINGFAQSGENGIFGVEENGRACGDEDAQNLATGSVIILFTPTNGDVRIGPFSLPAGQRYMIVDDPTIVGFCVYSANLRPSPSPSATPDVTDDPLETAEATPSPNGAPGPGPGGSPPPTPSPGADGPDGGTGDGPEESVSPEPVETETPTGDPSPTDDDDDPVCFPGDSTVELENGDTKTMAQLEIGDRVKVGDALYSDVFMFTHKNADIVYDFVRLSTSSGATLTATKGHYVYVNGAYAAASTAKVGDTLELGNGVHTTVESVSIVKATGLFNPQTVHGDIVVNSIRASTFTRAIEPASAQCLMAPLRMMYNAFGWSTAMLNNGADKIASMLPSGEAAL